MAFTPFSLEQLADLVADIREQAIENEKEKPPKLTCTLTVIEFGRLVATITHAYERARR